MKNARRRRVLVIIAAASGVAAFVACGFPEVAFVPDDAGIGAEASVDADTGIGDLDGGGGGDGPVVLPPDVDPEGGAMEASVRPDGGSMIDASGCTSCDCDGDGFLKFGGGCDGGAPGMGTTGDCDDTDDFIKPDAGFVGVTWPSSSHTPQGDWNCDTKTTKQYGYDMPCSNPNNCPAQGGFAGNPPCGESGTYNYCKYDPGIAGILLASCKVESTEQRTQGCR